MRSLSLVVPKERGDTVVQLDSLWPSTLGIALELARNAESQVLPQTH